MIEPARRQDKASAHPARATRYLEEQGLLKQFLVGSDVVAAPIAPAIDPPPTRSRGRPRKPTHKTPCTLPFNIITSAIKTIPPDKKGAGGAPAEPGRNKARERARFIVGRDARLSRSDIVVFDRLLDELRLNEGRCCHSNNWFAKTCGLDRSTVTRSFQALRNAGHILRRRRKSTSGAFFAETT